MAGGVARIYALAAALSAGALAAELARAPWAAWAWIGGGALVLAAAAARGRRRAGALLLAACALGGALAGLRLASVEGAALRTGAARGADAVLHGEALTDARERNGAARFVAGVRRASIDGRDYRVRERVWVSVRPPPRRLPRAGDLVRMDTRLGPLYRAGDGPPDRERAARDAANRLRRAGVAARAYASPDSVRRTGFTRNPLMRVASRARASVERSAAHLPQRERALLLGITIGDTSELDPVTELDFRETGLTHLLAVSGANVAMFLGAILVVLRFARAGPRLTLVILAFALLAFMTITRFEASVLRAGAMTGVGLIGMAIGARREALAALGVAVCGLICFDPFLVHSIGFQLSVGATLGILLLGPALSRRFGGGVIGGALGITLGAQLAVGPLIVLHFHQISLVTLAANLVAMPAVAPATVTGFVAAAADAVWAPLGAVAWVAQPPLAWMGWVASVSSALPFASVGTPGGPAGLGVAALLALMGWWTVRARRMAVVATALGLVVAGTTVTRAVAPPSLPGLSLTALDVGQGDALLVREPAGATMLIDGGPDPGLLSRALREAGVRHIDLLVLSHPHADHVSGLTAVARRYAIGRALEPGLEAGLPDYVELRAALADRGIPLDVARRGMRYRFGSAQIEVLWPAELLAGTPSDANNNSVVLRVRRGPAAILLTGDVEQDAQQRLLEHPEDLRAQVVKVAHHGSDRMLPELYAATGASVAVVSVGAGNDYGHPAPATLESLRGLGMRVLRTDESGTVSVSVDDEGRVTARAARGVPVAA